MTPGPKDDLKASTLRALGRTRIEIVPRDAGSVFVYWEVANTTEDPDDTPDTTFLIELRREAGDTTVSSLETSARLEGEIFEVPAGGRYYATLALKTDDGPQRLARSTTSAGPGAASSGEPEFVGVNPSETGLNPKPSTPPRSKPVRWNWRDTQSSNR